MTAIPKPEKRGPKAKKPIERKKRPARVRKTKPGQWKAMCDTLYSLVIRQRHGNRCFLCGPNAPSSRVKRSADAMRPSTGRYKPQCAHLISRRYHATRWFLGNEELPFANAWCLCWNCHAGYTFKPLEWDELVELTVGPVEWARMKRMAMDGKAPKDYFDLATRLRAELHVECREDGPHPELAESVALVLERFDRLLKKA